MKKFVLGLALAAAAVAGPAAASGDTYEGCLLRSGCFLVDNHWVCPDPGMYMMCVD
jgi:hypothetical protein